MVSETIANPNTQLLPAASSSRCIFLFVMWRMRFGTSCPRWSIHFIRSAKKPETSVRRYEHNGNWLEITPSVKGLATIYDKDILIYCISQIMHKLRAGEKVARQGQA